MKTASITRDSFGQAWIDLLRIIFDGGDIVHPRGKATREIVGVQFTVWHALQNVLVHPLRDLNYRFLVAEWLWIAAGRNDLEFLLRFNSQYQAYSDNGETLAGAYGPRLAPQWDYVVNTLARDQSSRQAVASIWTPNPQASRDVPCTLSFQFLLREGRLHLIATMRSSDIWLGLPHDFFSFSMLQNLVALDLTKKIGRHINVGPLTFNLGSSHLYGDHAFQAQEVLKHVEDIETVASPQFTSWPILKSEDHWVDQLDAILGDKDSQLTGVYEPWHNYRRVIHSCQNKASALQEIRRCVPR